MHNMNSSIEKLNQLHPKIKQDALNAYNEAVKNTPKGVHPVIDETFRSFKKSDDLYAQGRTKPGGIVSNSRGGQSYHNYGLALDFSLLINGGQHWEEKPPYSANWMIVVNTFKKYGFTWGGEFPGTFKDGPHLEKTLNHNWRELLELHNKGKVDKDGYVII